LGVESQYTRLNEGLGVETWGAAEVKPMISRIEIGSDMSKRWFDIHVLLGRKDHTARYSNNEKGRLQFIEDMRAFEAKKIHICMEFTGGLELALALACKEAGFIVSIVDGARINHFRRSFSSTGAGTDKKSAYLLARYCRERRPEEWFPVPDEYRKLRELVRHRERLVQCKCEWNCRLSNPTEDELVQAQRSSMVEVLLIQIKEVDRRIREHVKAHENLHRAAKLLQTIPGIAANSAYRILAEMGPIENYPCAKALALAAGLVPIVVHSGQKTPPGKLPVYGNRGLRTAFYFPALVCKRNGTGVAPFIERVGAKNKLKMTAIVAGMRKLAHVVYGVLTHETSFNPELMAT
jgi:transposase